MRKRKAPEKTPIELLEYASEIADYAIEVASDLSFHVDNVYQALHDAMTAIEDMRKAAEPESSRELAQPEA